MSTPIFQIGIALACAIVGALGYLHCMTAAKPKPSLAELCKIAYAVGLFFVMWAIGTGTWKPFS